MTEDILVRMGIDARPVTAALRGVRKDLADFKNSVSQIGPLNFLRSGLGTVGIAAGGAALVSFGKSAIDMAGEITDASEAVGATGETFQSWARKVELSGGTANDATAALGKLAEKANESGTTTDKALARLADQVQAATTPVEQLAIASDLLGEKLAVKVVGALKDGSKGLQEFKESIAGSMLTDAELNRLDEIGDKFGTIGARLRGWAGKGISLFSTAIMGDAGTAQMIKEINAVMAGGKSGSGKPAVDPKKVAEAAEKLAKAQRDLDYNGRTERGKAVILQKELLTLQEKARATEEGSVEQMEAKTKALEKQKELEDQIEKANKLDADFAKKKLDDKEKLVKELQKEREIAMDINDAERDRSMLQKKLETKLGDQTKFSLQDLASINPDRFTTRDMRRDIWNARRVAWLQNRAQALAARGYEEPAQRVLGFADKIRSGIKSLTSDERFPYEEMLNAENKQLEALNKLYEKASNEGMKVEVVAVAP